jgi:hypothetical protein
LFFHRIVVVFAPLTLTTVPDGTGKRFAWQTIDQPNNKYLSIVARSASFNQSSVK